MSWQSSDRRSRLPRNWAKLRAAVLRRDGYRCVHVRYDTGARCAHAATDVDHIEPNDNHAMDNLQSLCAWHHKQKTAQEAAQGRGRHARPPRRRPKDDHPSTLY